MGRLQVTICAARKLHDNQVIGIPDPYARIRLGKIHYKTKVIDNNLNPVWNETFTLQVADDNSSQLGIELWNDNVISDDLMGLYTLSVGNLVRGVVVDNWFVLTRCKTNAEIHVRVLAVDFGRMPEPADQWKVTTDINNDPQLSGAKPGGFGNPEKPGKPGKPGKVDQYGGSNGGSVSAPLAQPVYGVPVQPIQQPTYGGYAPQPAYGAPPPQPAYGAPPQPAYGAPPPHHQPYGAPPPQPYGAPPQPYGAPPPQSYGGGYGAPPPQNAYGSPTPPQQYGGNTDLPVPMGGVGQVYSGPPPNTYQQPPMNAQYRY